MLGFLTFLTFLPFSDFDFTIYFSILVFHSVFRKQKLGSSVIDQIDKTVFTAEFFPVANTLIGSKKCFVVEIYVGFPTANVSAAALNAFLGESLQKALTTCLWIEMAFKKVVSFLQVLVSISRPFFQNSIIPCRNQNSTVLEGTRHLSLPAYFQIYFFSFAVSI